METQDLNLQAFEQFKSVVLDSIKSAKEELDRKYSQAIKDGAPAGEVKTEMERFQKRLDAMEAQWSRGGVFEDHQKSLGQMVVECPAVQELASNLKAGGAGWIQGKRASFTLKSFAEFPEFAPGLEGKTTITSATVGSSTPGILVPERMPGIVKPGMRKVRVRDLIPRFPTSNNAVEWVKENAFTNNTSPTAETISKPESALTFTIDSAVVRTLASWIPAARQVLDDFVQLQAYVNQRLLEGLKDVEDYELVAGDGTGQHLSGMSSEATAYDTARNVSGDTKIDQLNHAISQIEDVLHMADGIILHPRDWRAIQLIKTEEGGANKGMYLLGGPQGTASATLWGLPVATTTAVTRGTFYVGAFQQYTAVFDRMDARIDISTEHYDYFIRNLIAIRAEERLTFVVTRADALIYGSFS